MNKMYYFTDIQRRHSIEHNAQMLSPLFLILIVLCAFNSIFVQANSRAVTRYMGSGIKCLHRGGNRDLSPGTWDHNPWDRDQQCFSWNQGSGCPQ